MTDKTRDLLQFVRTLKYYEEKLGHADGGAFNLFELLGVGSQEAATHTPYLGEFLDPNGSHGLGHEPLAAFVRRFHLNLDAATSRVDREFNLGAVTDSTVGRIDLLITDGDGRQVAIENKIDAIDQPNQLLRYKQGLAAGAQIIYLTLDGREPPNESIADKKDVLCLSYAESIMAWQDDCRRLAVASPKVRETITQYIDLLKHLTNQSTNTRMSSQIADTVLKDEASLAAFQELLKSATLVRERILGKLHEDCEQMAKGLGLQLKFQDLERKYGKVSFSDSSMRAQAISITFEFGSSGFRDLYFGVSLDHPSKGPLAPPTLLKEFNRVFGETGKVTEWWPAWTFWHKRRTWNDATFADIAFGRLQPELGQNLELLLKVVRAAQAAHAEPVRTSS